VTDRGELSATRAHQCHKIVVSHVRTTFPYWRTR
jgi:hypothetical protein